MKSQYHNMEDMYIDFLQLCGFEDTITPILDKTF